MRGSIAGFSPDGGKHQCDDGAVWDGVDGRDAAGTPEAAESGVGGARRPAGRDTPRADGVGEAAL